MQDWRAFMLKADNFGITDLPYFFLVQFLGRFFGVFLAILGAILVGPFQKYLNSMIRALLILFFNKM